MEEDKDQQRVDEVEDWDVENAEEDESVVPDAN